MQRSAQRAGGFTLIEGLLASAVLAVAAGALLYPFTVGAQNNVIVVDQAAAVNLGESLMEEILTRNFHDPDGDSSPGPESGETSRLLFDNFDDYDGYTEGPGHMKDAAGTLISESSLSSYGRSVSVASIRLPDQPADADPNFVRVIVTVTSQGRTVCELTRLIGAGNENFDGVQLNDGSSNNGNGNGNGNSGSNSNGNAADAGAGDASATGTNGHNGQTRGRWAR
ncbi:MAG: hypothetical protein BIFFINMI_01609 [Phycisphaerae bacterium]|nr:hypothetical protein [Phycisphaerae bacterium]